MRERRRGSRKPAFILQQSKWYRVGYLGAVSITVALIFSLSDSALYDSTGTTFELGAFASVLLAVIIPLIAYVCVQGSDPGYLSPDLMPVNTEPSPELEMTEVCIDECKEREDLEECKSIDGLGVEEDRRSIPTYCKICDMRRPLRAHHCRACGLCVATFDHHCYVIGTCVGERNHCRFFWFLLCQTLGIGVGLWLTHTGFRKADSTTQWVTVNSAAIVALTIQYSCAAFLLPLLTMHTIMALGNATGYECMKGADHLAYLKDTNDCDFPFSKGVVRNVTGFCCIRDGVWSIIGRPWRPSQWRTPQRYDRDSENWMENLWENKYWTCC